jgi:hypothetical protein
MSDVDEGAVGAVEDELRRYLLAYPGAADTASGIQKWWLPDRFAEEPAQRIQEALGRLVLGGVLVRVALPDGRTLYAAPDRGAGGDPHAS